MEVLFPGLKVGALELQCDVIDPHLPEPIDRLLEYRLMVVAVLDDGVRAQCYHP
jgi:hypothetical protein